MNYGGDCISEVQEATAIVLGGDFQILQVATGGVWGNQAPPTARPPYVVIAEALSIRKDILTRKGRIVTISLHIHDGGVDTTATTKIAARISSLMEHPGTTSGSGRRVNQPLPLKWPLTHIATRFLATQKMNVSLAVAHTIIQFEVEVAIHTQ